MSRENEKTLEVYNRLASYYISNRSRKHGEEPAKYAAKCEQKKRRMTWYMEGMSRNPSVLEIGSGAGDDVPMLRELGCRVQPSDGAQAFVDILQNKGYSPMLLDVSKKNQISGFYDMIYANHVFIHMTEGDLYRIMPKIYGSLRPKGRFIFNVGSIDAEGGRKSGWIDLPGFHHLGADRYFQYWKNTAIITLVENNGFVVDKYQVYGGEDHRRWIEICAKKT